MAQLARLKLGDTEIAALQKDISSILLYVGQVSAVSAEKVQEKPLQRNVMRDDTPRGTGDWFIGTEEAVRGAFPKREGGFNVVRRIIQKDE